MCLVSYISTQNGYFLTSNRDESPKRAETPLRSITIGNSNLICPIDQKGGSWIIMAKDARAICILNGAHNNHTRKSTYRLSRGVMMMEFFTFDHTRDFIAQYNFTNIEPFTMVIREKNKLYEFRWDEISKHIKILDTDQSYVWSSSTLYDDEMRRARKKVFFEEIKHIDLNIEAIMELHRRGQVGNTENNFVMNREDRVATISITCAAAQAEKITMLHNNLMSSEKICLNL